MMELTPRTFSGDLGLRPPGVTANDDYSSSRESSPSPNLGQKRKRSMNPDSDDNDDDDPHEPAVPPIADDDTPPPPNRPLIRAPVAFASSLPSLSTSSTNTNLSTHNHSRTPSNHRHSLPASASTSSLSLLAPLTLPPATALYQPAPVPAPTSKTIFLPGQAVAVKKPARRKKAKDLYGGQSGRFRLDNYDSTPSEAPPLQEGMGPYSSAFRGVPHQRVARGRAEGRAESVDVVGLGSGYATASTMADGSEGSASPAPSRARKKTTTGMGARNRTNGAASGRRAATAGPTASSGNNGPSTSASSGMLGLLDVHHLPSSSSSSSMHQMPTPVTDHDNSSPTPSFNRSHSHSHPHSNTQSHLHTNHQSHSQSHSNPHSNQNVLSNPSSSSRPRGTTVNSTSTPGTSTNANHYRMDYETGASLPSAPAMLGRGVDVNMGDDDWGQDHGHEEGASRGASPVPRSSGSRNHAGGDSQHPPSSSRPSSSRPGKLVTILAQDIRSGYFDPQMVEVTVPLRPAPNPSDGYFADAKEIMEQWQGSAARIDGPARVYALRKKYRQILLRVSEENVNDYASVNVVVERDFTLSVVVENIPTPGKPPPPPLVPPDMRGTEFAGEVRPVPVRSPSNAAQQQEQSTPHISHTQQGQNSGNGNSQSSGSREQGHGQGRSYYRDSVVNYGAGSGGSSGGGGGRHGNNGNTSSGSNSNDGARDGGRRESYYRDRGESQVQSRSGGGGAGGAKSTRTRRSPVQQQQGAFAHRVIPEPPRESVQSPSRRSSERSGGGSGASGGRSPSRQEHQAQGRQEERTTRSRSGSSSSGSSSGSRSSLQREEGRQEVQGPGNSTQGTPRSPAPVAPVEGSTSQPRQLSRQDTIPLSPRSKPSEIPQQAPPPQPPQLQPPQPIDNVPRSNAFTTHRDSALAPVPASEHRDLTAEHRQERQLLLAKTRKSKRGYETPVSDDEPAKVEENIRKAVEQLIQKDDMRKWMEFFRLKSGLETAANMVKRYEFVKGLMDKYVGEPVPFRSTADYLIEEKHILAALVIPDEDGKFAGNCKETLDLLALYGKDGTRYENPEVIKLMEEKDLVYNAKPIKRLLHLLREVDRKWAAEHQPSAGAGGAL